MTPRALIILAATSLLPAMAACGDDGAKGSSAPTASPTPTSTLGPAVTPTPSLTPTPTPTPTPVVVVTPTPTCNPEVYSPQLLDGTRADYTLDDSGYLSPLPNDHFTELNPSTGTGLRIKFSDQAGAGDELLQFGRGAEYLQRLDGWGTTAPIFFTFDGRLDPTSLDVSPGLSTRRSAPGQLIDINPRSANYLGRVPVYLEYYDDENILSGDRSVVVLMRPVHPLEPGGKYLALLTKDVATENGGIPVASETFERIKATQGDADPEVLELREALRPHLDALGCRDNLSRSDILVATHFTTQSAQVPLLALKRFLADAQAEAPITVDEAGLAQRDQNGQLITTGTFDAAEFRDPDTGHINYDAGDQPRRVSTVKLEFDLILPNPETAGPGPYPVVIQQHGLGGDRDGADSWQRRFVEQGGNYAFIAIDAPEHGSRERDGNCPLLDSLAGLAGQKSTFNFFRMCNGVITEPANLLDMIGTRDNFLQAAADQIQLYYLIQSFADLDLYPVGAPDGVPDLDVSKVAYVGKSFGAVFASAFNAVMPEVGPVVANVGGAGAMANIIDDSALLGILPTVFGVNGAPEGEFQRLFAISQVLLDAAEPGNWARYLFHDVPPGMRDWVPKNVLLQNVYPDGIVPNVANSALAQAARVDLARPVQIAVPTLRDIPLPISGNTAVGVTGVQYQYPDFADTIFMNHEDLSDQGPVVRQMVHFIQTSFDTGVGEVIDPAWP